MKLFSKIFGGGDETRRYLPVVDQVNALEPEFEALTDDQLTAKTAEFKQRFAEGATIDDLLPEAFAAVREAARRKVGQRHYDVQLIGGVVLHEGKISELKTGEGKTLTATLPLYLNALGGKGAHLVTVNDYLAKRDAQWYGPVYDMLGLSIGVLQHDSAFQFTSEKQSDTQNMEHLKPISRARGLPVRPHLRHQPRVRLRLPARQHVRLARFLRPARTPLRHRRRSRQHPHR